MPTRSELLSAHRELTETLRAAEEWEPSYRKSPKHLRRLIAQEADLQASLNGYFVDLRERAPRLVNWSEVRLQPIQASQVPPLSDDLWEQERKLLAAVAAALIVEMTATGAIAGETIYAVPLGLSPLHEAVLEGAGTQTAHLVKNVTKTTRALIQTSIRQSIAQGEDVTGAIARIQQAVGGPTRAELIAQTESVTAYQSGLDIFAAESGAVSSTWDALGGACKLCAPLDGTTVKIGESFVLANGNKVLHPPGHPRCRCGRIINYSS